MKIYYTRDNVSSREFLSRVLTEYCGAKDPQFVTGEHGKPRLAAGGPCFNLSHSGEVTAVAVDAREVGLDIQMRNGRSRSAILKRMTPAEKDEDFFRVWTAKEAYVKYLGSALSIEYPSLRFRQGVLYRNGEHANVSLFFHETDEYVLCLCTARPCAEVTFKQVRF